jgi:hypothetical protein
MMNNYEADIGNWDRGVVRNFKASSDREALDIAWGLVEKVREENQKGENDLKEIDLVQLRLHGLGVVWDYMNGWLFK